MLSKRTDVYLNESKKIRMLHCHIKTFLNHRILSLNVGAWSYVMLSSHASMIAIVPFLKSRLAGIKHDSPPQMLVSRDAHRLSIHLFFWVVISRAWVL